MWAVCKKEVRQFFGSLTGIIAIVVFLLLNGLFLFIFPDSSILEFGYATLDKFFELSPWIFIFLVPAITMRSFSDEFKQGTYEILRTKPLSHPQLIMGKYAGSFIIILLALIPTLIYPVCVQALSVNHTSIDNGATAGSYMGLFLLGAVYTSIGIYCSSLTSNAVVAFIISVFACYILYFGFNSISQVKTFAGGPDYYLQMLGIDFHYHSISRGVVDSRDLIYFISVIGFFFFLTHQNLIKRKP